MRFAKWVFLLAGISGIVVVAPLYFLEEQVGRDYPPPINHPEFFYGFAGVTLAWQFMFLVIASDPVRFRLAMLPAVLEKAGFVVAICVLYAMGRVHPPIPRVRSRDKQPEVGGKPPPYSAVMGDHQSRQQMWPRH